jgi:hypothetical protein
VNVATTDANGELVARTVDNLGDGSIETDEAYTRDAVSCLVTESTSTTIRQTEGGTVTRTETQSQTYDASWRVATTTIHAVTTAGDGVTTQDLSTSAAYTCE